MSFILLRLALAEALLLAVAPTFAQSAPPVAAYSGPRYPGGPDSLRALVGRSTRLAAPALAGRIAVEFELLNGQQPRNFKLLPRCIVPTCDGVFSGLAFRTELWDNYSTAAPAQQRQYGLLSNVVRKAYKR